jgi:hypothetical protein
VFVPHPDDAEDVREAFEAIDRGDVLSVEESAAYLRSLLWRKRIPEEVTRLVRFGARYRKAADRLGVIAGSGREALAKRLAV